MTVQTDLETQRKARAFDAKMAADARAAGRRSMLKAIGQTQGAAARASAEARLASGRTTAERQAAESAALPKSLAEAKGDARAFGKADMMRQVAAMAGEAVPASSEAAGSRASMVRELRKQGIEPAR